MDSIFSSMMDSISVNRSERDPLYSNELAFTAPPISENNLKRLNSCEAPVITNISLHTLYLGEE